MSKKPWRDMTPHQKQLVRDYRKRHRLANLEGCRAKERNWYAKNADRVAARRRELHPENYKNKPPLTEEEKLERMRARSRQYKKNHLDKVKEERRRYKRRACRELRMSYVKSQYRGEPQALLEVRRVQMGIRRYLKSLLGD